MHDHATDGGLLGYLREATTRDLRLHLDNSHNLMTSGWKREALAMRHEELHAAESERLGRIEAAADLIAHDLAIVSRPLCLTAADGTVYLAEQVDPRHMPTAGPLYRLTAQVPPAERVVDILEATKATLAASRAYLDAHKESAGAHLADSSAVVEPLPAGGAATAGAPRGEAS